MITKIKEMFLGEDLEKYGTERRIINALIKNRVRASDYISVLEEKDNIFLTKEGFGFAFYLTLPAFLGEKQEEAFEGFLNHDYPDGTIINFMSFSSSNIVPFLDFWEAEHSAENMNIDNPGILKYIVKKRKEYMLSAVKKSFWEDVEAKPRIIYNIMSVHIPFESDDPDIVKSQFRRVRKLASRIREAIKADGFGCDFVNADMMLAIYKEILNPELQGTVKYQKGLDFNKQVLDRNTTLRLVGGLESDLEVANDEKKKYWRGFWFSQYPNQMTLWKFSNILFPYDDTNPSPIIPTNFFMVMQVKVEDIEKRQAKITAKAIQMQDQAEKSEFARWLPKIRKRGEYAKYVKEVLEDGKVPYSASMYLFISADNQEHLDDIASGAVQRFVSKKFKLSREIDASLFNVMMECLPLNQIKEREDFFINYSTLFDANIASLMPFQGTSLGSKRPITLYLDRKYSLWGFDPFHSDTNYNIVKIAASGGGKSFSENDFHVLNLSAGRKIRVIDIGWSYKPLCSLLGGEYIELDDERNPCFNPFTHIIEDEKGNIHEDELAVLVPFVGLLAGLDLDPKALVSDEDNLMARFTSFIARAITGAYEKHKRKTGLKEVVEELQSLKDETGDNIPQRLAQALYEFSHGHYARYFNGENNIHYTKDYVVLELEQIENKDPRLKQAILYSLILRIFREFFLAHLKGDYSRKFLVVDEAWSILRESKAGYFLETAARRFRKYGCSLVIITQKIEDLLASPATRAIYANSAHLMILKPSEQDIEDAKSEKQLPVSDFEKDLILSLTTVPGKFSELIVRNSVLGTVIGRLIVDRYSYWTFTTNDAERRLRTELLEDLKDYELVLETLAKAMPIGEILQKLGYITDDQRLLILWLQANHPKYKSKLFGEIAVSVGFINEKQLSEAVEKQRNIAEELKKLLEVYKRK